jgi:hypothetical protein
MVTINGKELVFLHNVEKVIEFNNVLVIHLMSDDIPDNNIFAVDMQGLDIWNISDVIKLSYPEAYISLNKENEQEISVVSFNGLKSILNVYSKCVISKQITK